MKKAVLAGLAVLLAPAAALAQSENEGPQTTDLGFLVGTWNISGYHYNVSNPDAEATPESGTKVCKYTLEVDGAPSYITCINNSVYGEDSKSSYIEYINYNQFAGGFEKTNFFDGWPVKVIEKVSYDEETRVVEIQGRVEVENKIDSYVEYWRFNEDYSAFDREAWINLSSLPMTEYRLIVKGQGVKATQ